MNIEYCYHQGKSSLPKVWINEVYCQGGQRRSLLQTQRYPTARFSPLAKFVDFATSTVSVSSSPIPKTMEAATNATTPKPCFTFTLRLFFVTKSYIRTTSRASYFFAHSLFTITFKIYSSLHVTLLK